jgi:hypothetical protein
MFQVKNKPTEQRYGSTKSYSGALGSAIRIYERKDKYVAARSKLSISFHFRFVQPK